VVFKSIVNHSSITPLLGLPSSEESFKVQALTVSYEGKNTLRGYYRSINSCNNDSSNSCVNTNTISPFICYKFYQQAGRAQSFASKFKQAVKNFQETLKNELKSLTGKIGAVKNILAKLLKTAADSLQEFFSRLISAFFGFASWIQKIALKNNFSVNELKVELPSFEFSILMVGPYPLPVSKLTTPKLTATFVPVPAPLKKP